MVTGALNHGSAFGVALCPNGKQQRFPGLRESRRKIAALHYFRGEWPQILRARTAKRNCYGHPLQHTALGKLARVLDEQLARAGYDEVEHFDVSEAKLGFCQGEFDCWVNRPGRCKIDDAQQPIVAAIPAAHALVYLGPVVCDRVRTRPRTGAGRGEDTGFGPSAAASYAALRGQPPVARNPRARIDCASPIRREAARTHRAVFARQRFR